MNIHSLLKVKRDLRKEKSLDGLGGFTVWSRLTVANDSLSLGSIPIGLAHGVQLKSNIKEGQVVTWSDVNLSMDIKNSMAKKSVNNSYDQFKFKKTNTLQCHRSDVGNLA